MKMNFAKVIISRIFNIDHDPLHEIGFAMVYLLNALPENELSGMCDA